MGIRPGDSTAVAGEQNVAIAEKLGVSPPTVLLWRKRVREQGIGEVWQIAPGRGRKPQYDQATRERIIQATLHSKPPGMTHWSCRLMAEAQQVSPSTVNRLWQLHNLKPHLSRTFKLSRDRKFLEKLTDVVGLYLNLRRRPWYCVWMKRVKFKRWIARSRDCR